MSKKTILLSVVLITMGTTILESRILGEEELMQAEMVAATTQIAKMATQESVKKQCIISDYDEMMRRISAEEGQDWLLMSAIAYNESRFKSHLVSKRGAIGLMQVMPIVGKQFNVDKEQIADPETNIRLAGKLLTQIDRILKISPSASTRDRLSIILASYNGGVGHIADARRLAKVNGEDYNSWEVVARYLKQKADPSVYESDIVRHGKFTGSRQTEAYVRDVMKRYDIYRKMINQI
jgi:membrane-bound lytic murein transglycosylase F